jgi:hypothetical protein
VGNFHRSLNFYRLRRGRRLRGGISQSQQLFIDVVGFWPELVSFRRAVDSQLNHRIVIKKLVKEPDQT